MMRWRVNKAASVDLAVFGACWVRGSSGWGALPFLWPFTTCVLVTTYLLLPMTY